jgi:hypothetical protein
MYFNRIISGSLGGITYTAILPNNIAVTHTQGTTLSQATISLAATSLTLTLTADSVAGYVGTSANGKTVTFLFNQISNSISVDGSGNITINRTGLVTAVSNNLTNLVSYINTSANWPLSSKKITASAAPSSTATLISTSGTFLNGTDTQATAVTTNTTTAVAVRIAAAETNVANVVTAVNSVPALAVTASGTGSITSKTGTLNLLAGAN